MTETAAPIESAEFVLPCDDLDATVLFFEDRLGFRLEAIFPADDPATAVMTGHGLRLRIDAAADTGPGTLRLLCADPDSVAGGERTLTAPNGTRVDLVDVDPPVTLPPLEPEFVLSRLADDASWVVGRAGMRYRDLIPGRLGGRFIASHIHIPDGGPVPDYVHYHKVRFQMIYCYRGWVRLVYEDQGPEFVMRAGDCVLQPPTIRHRVLESSDNLEVVEIGCPADHETLVDHDLTLPTGREDPQREFGGQRFVRHEIAKAVWRPWHFDGFECRDLGIADATAGLAGVRVARRHPGDAPTAPHSHDAEFCFHFVLEGAMTLECDGNGGETLGPGDAYVVPAGHAHAITAASADLEILEATLPAAPEFNAA